jgi:hypothetical protein
VDPQSWEPSIIGAGSQDGCAVVNPLDSGNWLVAKDKVGIESPAGSGE